MKHLTFASNAKLYFASDFHLGVPTAEESLQREKKIVRWLEMVSKDAEAIFLVGDLFDFWFEYKKVVPKGFVRFIGKVSELVDKGIPVYFFRGNHDLWMRDYFEQEIGVTVFHEPIVVSIGQHKLLVAHGDGLGPGDYTFKKIKKVFDHSLSNWLFRWLHPDIGVWLAHTWSSRSRVKGQEKDKDELHCENEWLFQYAQEVESKRHFDYYIFGHRHIPIMMEINQMSTYINLGEWVYDSHYCVFQSGVAKLIRYED